MTKYNYNLYKQRNMNPIGNSVPEWVNIEHCIKSERTEKNIKLAISKEQKEFFTSIGSKQVVKKGKINSKKYGIIYSYCPSDINLRYVHEYIEK